MIVVPVFKVSSQVPRTKAGKKGLLCKILLWNPMLPADEGPKSQSSADLPASASCVPGRPLHQAGLRLEKDSDVAVTGEDWGCVRLYRSAGDT